MGRRLKSILPVSHELLKPKGYSTSVEQHLKHRQQKQKMYHDRSARDLKSLDRGDVIRVRQDGKWEPGVVEEKSGHPRSYHIQTPSGEYRRNRSNLLKTNEDLPDMTNVSIEGNSSGYTYKSADQQETVVKISHSSRTSSGRLIKKVQRYIDEC